MAEGSACPEAVASARGQVPQQHPERDELACPRRLQLIVLSAALAEAGRAGKSIAC